MLVCVALTRGRVIASSLPTVTSITQPCMVLLSQVTPSLRFSRKIYKKIRNPDPTKLKLKSGGKFSGDGHNFLVQDGQVARAARVYHDVLLRKRA